MVSTPDRDISDSSTTLLGNTPDASGGGSRLKAWITLIASIIFMMYPGSVYIQGAITPYIGKYMSIV